jgi:hypothetical protein
MRAKQENIKLEQNNTTSQYRIYSQKAAMVMKTRYKIAGLAVVAVAGSLLLGGSLWWWFAGVFAGKLIVRLFLTVALAVILYFLIYILIYASIIGGILWILIG